MIENEKSSSGSQKMLSSEVQVDDGEIDVETPEASFSLERLAFEVAMT